jgi:hypothetical protein
LRINDQSVGCASQLYARAAAVGGLRGIELERDRDVAASAALIDQALQVLGKATKWHQTARIHDGLLGQLCKARMDPRRSAVCHGVAKDAVQIGAGDRRRHRVGLQKRRCNAENAADLADVGFQRLLTGEIKAGNHGNLIGAGAHGGAKVAKRSCCAGDGLRTGIQLAVA